MNDISNIDTNTDIDKYRTEIPLSANTLIRNHLKNNGQTITWLAQKVQLDSKYLTAVLIGHHPLTEKNRQKINEVFKTEY